VTSPVTLALLAGVLGAVQPRLNAELAERLGNDVVAATINFVVAMLVAAGVLALRRSPQQRLAWADVRAWDVPRWTFASGLGGVLAVLSGVIAVDAIGVATFSVAFFAGQVASGLVVDALGLAPGGKRPLSRARVAASALALVAVVVAELGRGDGDAEPLLVAFVVFAGVAVSFQAAGNARLSRAAGDAVIATQVNTVVGAAALVTLVAAGVLTEADTSLDWPATAWLYLGGVLGVGIVLSLAIATAELGVLRTTVAMVAAQLTAAFAVDAIVDGASPHPAAVAGALLLVVAVRLLRGSQVRSSTSGS
jgi:transporter family-2 protein